MVDFTFAHREEGFDEHIEKSIRGYSQLMEDVVALSRYFVENGTTVVDIGCSTGKMTKALIDYNRDHIEGSGVEFIGIENAEESIYAQSKLKGEKEILNNFNKAVIVRPSIVYSVDDNFTTQLMTLLGLLPIFPIYYNGKTKFRPIHCSDLTNSITKIITDDIRENIIEFAGPEEMSFKEILENGIIPIFHPLN